MQFAASPWLVPTELSSTGIERKERLIRTDSRLAIVEFINKLYLFHESGIADKFRKWIVSHAFNLSRGQLEKAFMKFCLHTEELRT